MSALKYTFSPVSQWTAWRAVLTLNWTCCPLFGTVKWVKLPDVLRKLNAYLKEIADVCGIKKT